MYGVELSNKTASELLEIIDGISFKNETIKKSVRKLAKKLSDESKRLFCKLDEAMQNKHEDTDSGEDESQSRVSLDIHMTRHLRNIRIIADEIAITLRGEIFHIEAMGLLTWIQAKYNADISRIDLRNLIPTTVYEATSVEDQRKMIEIQTNHLFKAICKLPEINNKVEVKKEQCRQLLRGHNPERLAMKVEFSDMLHSIWHRTRKLLASSPDSMKSESLARMIWKYEAVRRQSTALSKQEDIICWHEIRNEEKLLSAIPKDLGKRLYKNLWAKGVPTILTSGTLSANGDFSHARRTLGLDALNHKLTKMSVL
jgi:hypothetical protein